MLETLKKQTVSRMLEKVDIHKLTTIPNQLTLLDSIQRPGSTFSRISDRRSGSSHKRRFIVPDYR